MSVKTYSYKNDGDKKLSEHFKVREFGSFSGSKVYSDKVLVNTELVEKLEKLFSYLNASKAIINSGYRCVAHDKAVGGSGYGQHVNGNAADVVFYDRNGKVISTKYVCCVASELGFNGIANISARYCATHLDVRSGSKYWGDEIYNYSSIWKRNSKWTNFYKYWNLDRDEVLSKFKKTTTSTEISKPDVIAEPSESKAKVCNGNWNVRKSPITGAIIKILVENTLVTYTQTKNINNKTWYYLNEYSGWICGDGLKTTGITNTSNGLTVASGKWNVRKTPATGAIITTVKKGSQFTYRETKKVNNITWYKISINGSYGWLSGKAVAKTY